VSLINKMLQDLERRQDAPADDAARPATDAYKDLRAVPASRAPASRRMAVVATLIVTVAVGAFVWARWGGETLSTNRVQSAVSAPAQAPAPDAKNMPVAAGTARVVPTAQVDLKPLDAQTGSALSEKRPAPSAESGGDMSPKEPSSVESAMPSRPGIDMVASAPTAEPKPKVSPPIVDHAARTAQAIPVTREPSPSAPTAPKDSGVAMSDYWVVQQGENLYAIARKTGHSLQQLVAWNGITAPHYLIRPGQRLRLSSPQQRVIVTGSKTVTASKHSVPPAIKKAPSASVAETSPDEHSGVVEKRLKPLSTQERAEGAYRQATRSLQQGRTAEAESRLRTALAANPAHLSARNLLVGVALKNGRWQEAQKLLEEGIRLAPQHYPFVQLLARIHIKQGHESQALAQLEGTREYATTDPDYQALLATLYQRVGRHAEAVMTYQRAVSLRPQEGRWWLGMAISLEAERSWQNAAQAYQRATVSGTLDENLLQYAQQRLAVVKNKQ